MFRFLQYLLRVNNVQKLYIFEDFYALKEADQILKMFVISLVSRFQFSLKVGEPRGLEIMYHNVQSLYTHFPDIESDRCFMSSDILLFTETRTIEGDDFRLRDFHDPFEIIGDETERIPNGVSIYLKKRILDEGIYDTFPNYYTGIHMGMVIFKRCRITVIYAKPHSLVREILKAIELAICWCYDKQHTILIGCFNIEMESESGKQLRSELANEYNLQIRTNPRQYTTKGRTTVDAIFSTEPLPNCGVYENTFGYHLPLYARIN